MRQLNRCRLLAAVLVTACGGDSATGPTPPPGPVVATVEVTPAADTVRVGAVVQFLAVAKDAQGTAVTGRTVSWTTSNSAMATVSPAGEVTGVARGTATVTATVDGRSGSATVVVQDETSLLPAAGCRDCLEIVPGGLLLTGPGQEAPLAAYQVDAAGARTKVSATFTSAKPAVVTVSGTGVARAVAYGSAQVTAAANGKTSAPVVVTVASPVEGALVVADTLVVGRPVAVNPRATYGVGYRYKVRVRGLVPSVGQMLIGSGNLPVLGRVVRVTPLVTGLTETELELRPVSEVFREFSVHETMRLAEPAVPATPTPGFWPSARMPQLADDPLTEGQFRLGPFVCESNVGASLSFPLNVLVEQLDLNPQLDLELLANSTGSNMLVVTGTLSPQLTVTAKLTAAVQAEIECRKTVRKLRLSGRLGGALSMLVFPLVPVGVGFKLGIEAGVPDLALKGTLQGSMFAGLAMNCSSFRCAFASQPPGGGLTPSFTPTIPPLTGRIKAEGALFAFAKLELSNVLAEGIEEAFGEDAEVTLLDFLAGAKQTIALASPTDQASDSQYAAEAKLAAFWEAEAGAEVEFGDLLSLQFLDYTAEGDTSLARTPRGTLDVSADSVRAAAYGQPGDPLLLRATLWPVRYLGIPSVTGVEFFWKGPTGLVRACFVEPDHPGQVEFECEFSFTEEHVGPQTFYAFVHAGIFGVPFATPFELAEDAKVTVQVVKEPPLLITTTALPGGMVGAAYSAQLQSSGGSGAPTWHIVAGLLPAGLSLNPSTGAITGNPTETCTCDLTVEVRRGQQTAAKDLSIQVNPPSLAGRFSGTWTYTDGPQAGVVRSTGGEIRVADRGAYGNHLLSFQNVDGGGGCGLIASGATLSVVTADNDCRFRYSLSLYYYGTSWSMTRDEIRISFATLAPAPHTRTAELRLTRLP